MFYKLPNRTERMACCHETLKLRAGEVSRFMAPGEFSPTKFSYVFYRFVKEVTVKNGKPITNTYFKINLSKLKERSCFSQLWVRCQNPRRVHALFCFAIVCSQSFVDPWSFFNQKVSFFSHDNIISTVERIIVECLRNHSISNFSFTRGFGNICRETKFSFCK